jgi:hypothetical protein
MEEEQKRKKINSFKEKVKKAFKKMALTGITSASLLAPSYSAFMYAPKLPSEGLEKYKYEISLIQKGDIEKDTEESYRCYERAMLSIKERQDEVGEGKDIELDYLRVYTVYAMARAPPQPEYAERYLFEARELAKKYYEMWKDPIFLHTSIVITENLGFIYFDLAEDVRKNNLNILLLKNPVRQKKGVIEKLVVGRNDVSYFLNIYPVKKIISSENFTEICSYYETAKKYYEEYLRFYNESREIKEIIKKYPGIANDYKERNDRVLSHLKIIDEVLSKCDPNYKKESSKEEKKEITEKKNNNKETKKTYNDYELQKGL